MSESAVCQEGLSPRGRGNHAVGHADVLDLGSIPAWAGEPHDCGGAADYPRVYPRVGGGTFAPLAPSLPQTGLSPRGRGNRDDLVTLACGLSPRGRGNRGARLPFGRGLRSIPAWAGEPRYTPTAFSYVGSIPAWAGEPSLWSGRVGGGVHTGQRGSGLSPRGRGNRCVLDDILVQPTVYPRVGGGTLHLDSPAMAVSGLSPRGRGNRTQPMYFWHN